MKNEGVGFADLFEIISAGDTFILNSQFSILHYNSIIM